MRPFLDLLKRFRRDENGAFMVLFAVLAIVLIATSGAVVDFTSMQTARSRAQTSLDSAALALQSRISIDNIATLKTKAQSIVTQSINDASITATITGATVDTTAGKLNLEAQIVTKTAFVQLVGIQTITAHLQSEVTRGSVNLEVSVALDITGSMLGQKLTDLKSATNTLIDMVVQDSQTPTYSKMSIIPWSNAVNVGSSYAAAVRGAVTGPTTMTSATWIAAAAVNIGGASPAVTKANPAVVNTSTNHGLVAGDYIYISGVSGMTNLNGNIYKVGTVNTTKQFRLQTTGGSNVNSSSWNAWTSGGTITKCYDSSCHVMVTTSSAHGHATGDTVYIDNAGGMTALNGTHAGAVGTTTSTTYILTDETVSTVSGTYTANSASSHCAKLGCDWYYFATASGGHQTFAVSNCVSDRTTNPYTNDPPSTTKLGYVYPASNNPCLTQSLIPLSIDKTALKAVVTGLAAAGSTAGHLGAAWGWYMVDPNFAYLWPTASQPALYTAANTLKAVVLMTDGDFNTTYCSGVISADAGSGSGNSSDHISCNSPNGASMSQALSICSAIKAKGIVLYTVGFDMAGNTTAATNLTNCATDADHYFQADTGTDLQTAFAQIGQSLQELRLSK